MGGDDRGPDVFVEEIRPLITPVSTMLSSRA
jgi:hypothetical protein